MASKRAVRRRACAMKIRHATEQGAVIHAIELRRKDGADRYLNIYRCQFCRGWHVGHFPQRIRQAMADRRRT